MKDLVYLTLTRNYDTVCELVVLRDKINDAAEEMFCQHKDFGENFKLYVNKVEVSICGILVKGEYQHEIDLSKWM